MSQKQRKEWAELREAVDAELDAAMERINAIVAPHRRAKGLMTLDVKVFDRDGILDWSLFRVRKPD